MKKILIRSLLLLFISTGLLFLTASVALAGALSPTAIIYLDSGTPAPDGTVDQIKLTFSNVTACAFEGADWAAPTPGTIGVSMITAIANPDTCTSDEYILLTVAASAGKTGGDSDPLITYTDAVTAGSVVADGNQGGASFLVTDSAAPVYLSSQTLDNNNDGTVDYISVTYTEPILDSSVAGDGTDFAAGIVDTTAGNLTESFASLTPSTGNVTDTANDATIYIGVTSGSETISTKKTDYTLKIQQVGVVKDVPENSLASFSSRTSTDGAKPIIATVTIEEAATPVDGKIDKITFTWSENIDTDDGSPPIYGDLPTTKMPDGWSASFTTATITDPAGTSPTVTVTGVTGQQSVNTAVGSTVITGDLSAKWKDSASNTPHATGATANESIIDSAAPVYVTSSTLDNNGDGTVDYVAITYSEAMLDSSVAGTDFAAGIADTTAGNLTESFASLTPSSGTVTDTANDTIIYVGVASSGETISTYKTDYTLKIEQIGAVTDSLGNSRATFSLQTSTDGAAPTYVSSQTLDNDSNGTVDYIKILYSESVLDSSVAATDFVAGIELAGPLNLTESFTSTVPAQGTLTDTANDSTIYIGVTSGSETITSSKTDYTLLIKQSGAITDSRLNSYSGFDSQTSTDGAKPVLLTVTRGASILGKNTLEFAYSEALSVPIIGLVAGGSAASTSSVGDMTTAGTIAGIGSFATAGGITVPTTLNTVGLSQDSKTITITLGGQAGGYIQSAATEAQVAGTFTAAASTLTDANGVATVNTSSNPTETYTTSWDYTRPTITGAVLYDNYSNDSLVADGTFASGQDGKPDTIIFTSSETLVSARDGSTVRDDWTLTSTSGEYGANLTVVKASATGASTEYTLVFSGSNIYYDLGTMTITYGSTASSFQNTAGVTLSPTSGTVKVCTYGYSCTAGAVNYAVMTISLQAPSPVSATPPSKPTDITAVQSAVDEVTLTWKDSVDTGINNVLDKIVILRGKNELPVSGGIYASIEKGIQKYIDTDVKAGDTVKYILKARNKSNKYSDGTTEISITVKKLDRTPPEVKSVEAREASEILIIFTENIDTDVEKETFLITDENNTKLEITEVSVSDNLLTLKTVPQIFRRKYTIKFPIFENLTTPIKDSNGNAMEEAYIGTFIGAAVAPFRDVTLDSHEWAIGSINWARESGYVAGRSKGIFEPGSKIVRAELATMLVKAMLPENEKSLLPDGTNNFEDVLPEMWYTPYINYLYDAGITRGRQPGLFVPTSYASRAEVVSMLVKWLESTDSLKEKIDQITEEVGLGTWENPYSDIGKDAWYTRTTAIGTYYGIIKGKEVNKQKYAFPLEKVTRAEAVVMLKRAFDLIEN